MSQICHPKDILRSLSHELMHHTQKCRGDFKNTDDLGEQGYAQNNNHLRFMEIEAYQASIVFRDWEDSIKETIYNESLQKGEKTSMSIKDWKHKELSNLLAEAWGFDFKLLNEEKSAFHACATHVKENKTGREGKCINHILTESGDATHYTVEFDTEIIEGIPINELAVLEKHDHEHPAKRDDYEHDEDKPRRQYALEEDEEEPVEEGGAADRPESKGKGVDQPDRGKRIQAEGAEEVESPGKYMGGARQKAGVDKDGDGVPDNADKDPKDGSISEAQLRQLVRAQLKKLLEMKNKRANK